MKLRKLATKDWVDVSSGLVSGGGGKVWEAHEIGYTFWGDCCWEVEMRKDRVAIKRRKSL